MPPFPAAPMQTPSSASPSRSTASPSTASLLDVAKARLEDLERERAEIATFIAVYERLEAGRLAEGSAANGAAPTDASGSARADGQTPTGTPARSTASNGHSAPRPGPTRRNNDRPAIMGAMREILGTAGHPLKRAELLAGLEGRGIAIDAVDPGDYINKMLWEARHEVSHAKGVGYSLVAARA